MKTKQEIALVDKSIDFYNLDDYESALICCDEIISKVNPKSENAWINKARALIRLGDSISAIICCEKVINEMNPENEEAWFNKGNALLSSKIYNDATSCYDKVIEIDPMHKKAWCNKAASLIALGDYKSALAICDKIIHEIDSEDGDVWVNRGNCFQNLGDNLSALFCYNKVTDEINIEDDIAWANKAGVLYFLGDHASALLCCDRVLNELNPQSEIAWNNKGMIFVNTGKPELALACCDKVISEIDPNSKGAWFLKTLALYNLKRLEEALYCCDLLIFDFDYKYEQVFCMRAKIRELNGEIYNAYQDYNTCLYLCLNEIKTTSINDLLSFFQPYPQNIITLLDKFEIDDSDFILQYYLSAIKSIGDFRTLLEYYKIHLDLEEFSKVQAVLYYYLGGPVESYNIFKELLTASDSRLNSQEYYYYAKAALDINWEANHVIEFSITEVAEMSNKNSIDNYYLGHLYCLKATLNLSSSHEKEGLDISEDIENAVDYFNLSQDYLFSKVMLSYLLDSSSYIANISQVDIDTIHHFSLNIDFDRHDLSQFQNYFHLNECKDAIDSFDDLSRTFLPIEYQSNFGEIFKFTEIDRRNIDIAIKKRYSETILKNLSEEFNKNLSSGNIEKKKESMDELWEKEVIYDRNIKNPLFDGYSEIRDRINDIEMKGGTPDVEILIGNALYWLISNHYKYASGGIYYIYYYYYDQKINGNQVFNLILYLRYYIEDSKFVQILKDIADLGIMMMPNISLSVKIGMSFYQKVYKNLNWEKYEAENGNYKQFIEHLWTLILCDKETLSADEFNNKYLGLIESYS